MKSRIRGWFSCSGGYNCSADVFTLSVPHAAPTEGVTMSAVSDFLFVSVQSNKMHRMWSIRATYSGSGCQAEEGVAPAQPQACEQVVTVQGQEWVVRVRGSRWRGAGP